jgi:endonuclease/exonuclease/phosphatase family metal-dependent hydrolase
VQRTSPAELPVDLHAKPPPTIGQDDPVPTLRVMTYNVRSMRDDRAALARVIRAADPDVALIQESPRFFRWRTLCAQLARTANLVVVSGGRPAGSNLILSSLAVDVESTADVLFTRDPQLHQRGTAIAVLRKQGRRFAVAGTHLDLREAPRWRHAEELEHAIAAAVPPDVPVIVAGDINDVPSSRVWRRLAEARADAFAVAGSGDGLTSSPREPQRRIDGIFVDRRMRVTAATTVDNSDVLVATDHRPVIADLEWD